MSEPSFFSTFTGLFQYKPRPVDRLLRQVRDRFATDWLQA